MPKKARGKKQVTPERLMQLSFAYAPPLIVGAAVSDRIFDTLADGAKTIDQMSKETERGDTFSFDEIKRWLEATGFKKVRKLDAPGPSPFVLATKPT